MSLVIKQVSLVVLVLQTTSLVLLLKYSRTQGEVYFSSTAVFLGEVLKLLSAWVVETRLVAREQGWGYLRASSHIYHQLVDSPLDTFKVAVPAGLYALQNNLLFFALSNLPAATYQVLYQMKILTTAIFSVTMLNKAISMQRWASLVVLMAGVALVQLTAQPQTHRDGGNPFLGLLAVVAASVTSGFAGVYFEKILKGTNPSIFFRNIQLGLFGAVTGIFLVASNDGHHIAAKGFFYGYNWVTVLVICNHALGGLVVAVVVKYADNIVKTFANAVSIVLSAVLAVRLFGFTLTPYFLAGTGAVVSAVIVYSLEPFSFSRQGPNLATGKR